jgi:hypothetical protein
MARNPYPNIPGPTKPRSSSKKNKEASAKTAKGRTAAIKQSLRETGTVKGDFKNAKEMKTENSAYGGSQFGNHQTIRDDIKAAFGAEG